ncbi:MAG: VIT1/CCC1 transporter family protein [Alicyclobacillus sp.]|nr:VIT1/CCC1 transporter family protein [Alicyclobacillus sp.]
MPKADHVERHAVAPATIRDIVIGMADGLTVPFALAAGLSGAVSTTVLVVTAGLAEIAAGSIAMGLGGYLAAQTDHEHYMSELAREQREIAELPDRERQEVANILKEWGIAPEHVNGAVEEITRDPERWVSFMMRHELGLEEPKAGRARNSSLTIGISYIVGGLIPLIPYMVLSNPSYALIFSVFVTLIALFVFGFVKAKFMGTRPFKTAWQTVLVGGLAAGVAYEAARLVT